MGIDPVDVDPEHYKVEFENDRVRALRISYGPKEKSGVMHDHPDAIGVFLSDVHGKFTFPDGTTKEITGKAGEAAWFPAVTHLPENLSDEPIDMLVFELKG
ncbi:MAG: cytoplasmic protein [Thermoplasmata archaeon]